MSPSDKTIFPGAAWEGRRPEEMGMDAAAVAAAGQWLADNDPDRGYRALVMRGGYVVAEFNKGIAAEKRTGIGSGVKSLYGCMLAIAEAEGVIKSVDDPVVDYYPAMMDVPEGTGPKPGRFAREKDRAITFRQLISNTSGYLKPGESPGEVFHYQTYGMNILSHAIAAAYGRYDPADPEGSPGFGPLLEEKIRDRIGASWTWQYFNFELPPAARTNIFGNMTCIDMTAADMARLGWLWCNEGRWGDEQVVPAEWIRQSTKVNPVAAAAGPGGHTQFGQGFWCNDRGSWWPDLPRDSFAASGAGWKFIFCCPSLELVIGESPGVYDHQTDENTGFAARIVAACR